MNDSLISTIRDFTLTARHRLEREADEQLQGLYGWLPDGCFANSDLYPAIKTLEEARETRRRLELFVADEKDAGLAAPDARKKLLRETAFTWLNRLVAFRLFEERKLLKATISKQNKDGKLEGSAIADSDAFKRWVVLDTNTAAYAEYQKGDMPKNAIDEGPRETAYRQFILCQCASLAAEVSILFDPTNLASRLCPRPAVLKQLVESIGAADLTDAWKHGNEETIGWLYQAFNSQELKAAFAAANADNKKFEPADIPAVTQLFTIRWVVRFLVQNTLGRLWVEMHPDSRLAKQLDYLVPVTGRQRAFKSVRDISFLDPCCGSMHFGLVAFDLFVEMYCEELDNAGKDGWPAKASVASKEEIPGSIVAHNLFGIDLDLRAVQLSALAIFQRARSLNPKCAFTDENFACANVEAITGGRLEELISATDFGNRVEERILRALAAKVADSPNLGSLLRLERDLTTLVDAERKKLVASSQPELLLAGLTDDLFISTRDLNAFFDQLTESIATRLDAFARDAGSKSSHTAGEAAKGLRFLRLVQRRYDVVATNPPYLSNRKMNKRLQSLLGERYTIGKQDLYAAFVLRCQELLAPQGLLGMLSMHSFMFISSYEDMRKLLRDEVAIETMGHFGGHLFTDGNSGTLQTAAFVLRKEPNAAARQESQGVYFRLVRERDSESKRKAFEIALQSLRAQQNHPRVFIYRQGDFDTVPGKPFAYWLSANLRSVFSNHRSFESVASWKRGLATGVNKRFIRYAWEVGPAHRTSKWFPYMKGGKALRWYGNDIFLVNWQNDGTEIRNLYTNGRLASRPQNVEFYFREGLTYGSLSSKGFTVRFMPRGYAFDQASNSIFVEGCSPLFLLAYLNSTFSNWVLSLNPTVNIVKDDLQRIPICSNSEKTLSGFGAEAVKSAQRLAGFQEREANFCCPPWRSSVLESLEVEAEVSRAIEAIEVKISKLVFDDLGVPESERALLSESVEMALQEIESEDGEEESEEELEEVSESALGDNRVALSQSWISYALGTVLGRYAIGEPDGLGSGDFDAATVTAIRALIDPDGVMVAEKDHPQDIVRRTVQCLEAMRGLDTAHALIRTVVCETNGDPEDLLRGWLDRFTGQPADSFWKYHHQIYRKRPIFWPFQSPDKNFTVWVFQERFTRDTLFKMRQEFVDPRLNRLRSKLEEIRSTARTSTGREKREAEKRASALVEELEDLEEFSKRLNATLARGYSPCIDDGVLLNAAPLWELLPSWSETKKAWKELKDEKYEWAHQAMHHWPERVKKACQTNRSFAIAHGLA